MEWSFIGIVKRSSLCPWCFGHSWRGARQRHLSLFLSPHFSLARPSLIVSLLNMTLVIPFKSFRILGSKFLTMEAGLNRKSLIHSFSFKIIVIFILNSVMSVLSFFNPPSTGFVVHFITRPTWLCVARHLCSFSSQSPFRLSSRSISSGSILYDFLRSIHLAWLSTATHISTNHTSRCILTSFGSLGYGVFAAKWLFISSALWPQTWIDLFCKEPGTV